MNKSDSIPSRKKAGDHWIIWTAILAVILILICVSSILVIRRSISLGISGAKEGFAESYNDVRENVKNEFIEAAHKISEEMHHVSNKVTISINAVQEKERLEVLKVSDVVYIVTDSEETKSGTTSWLKVKGTGIFTVNLAAAEYLVDNSRHYVLVRIPSPVLDSDNISIDSYESLLFKENIMNFSNSISSGEQLAQAQLSEAQQQIQEDFLSNEKYEKIAKDSSKSMVAAFIKSLNSDISDLEVEVEFYPNSQRL